jgi:hypothetical protein
VLASDSILSDAMLASDNLIRAEGARMRRKAQVEQATIDSRDLAIQQAEELRRVREEFRQAREESDAASRKAQVVSWLPLLVAGLALLATVLGLLVVH